MTSLENLLLDLKDIKVIDSAIPYSKYISLDLSASNLELNQLNISDAVAFEAYIDHHLNKNKASVAYGGYNEIAICIKGVPLLMIQTQKNAIYISDWTYGLKQEHLFWLLWMAKYIVFNTIIT